MSLASNSMKGVKEYRLCQNRRVSFRRIALISGRLEIPLDFQQSLSNDLALKNLLGRERVR